MQATVLLEEYTYGAPIMDFSHGSDGGNVIVAQLQASGKVYVSTRTFSTTSHERLVITRDPLPLGRDVTVYVRLADGGTVSVYFDRVLQVEEETEHMTPEYGVRTVALIGASSFAEDKDINGTVQNFAFSACLVGTDAPQSTSTFENVQTGAPSSAPDTSPSSSFPVWVVAVPVAVVFCLLLLCCVWAFFFRQTQQARLLPAVEEQLVQMEDALDSASDVADAEHMEQGLLDTQRYLPDVDACKGESDNDASEEHATRQYFLDESPCQTVVFRGEKNGVQDMTSALGCVQVRQHSIEHTDFVPVA